MTPLLLGFFNTEEAAVVASYQFPPLMLAFFNDAGGAVFVDPGNTPGKRVLFIGAEDRVLEIGFEDRVYEIGVC